MANHTNVRALPDRSQVYIAAVHAKLILAESVGVVRATKLVSVRSGCHSLHRATGLCSTGHGGHRLHCPTSFQTLMPS